MGDADLIDDPIDAALLMRMGATAAVAINKTPEVGELTPETKAAIQARLNAAMDSGMLDLLLGRSADEPKGSDTNTQWGSF